MGNIYWCPMCKREFAGIMANEKEKDFLTRIAEQDATYEKLFQAGITANEREKELLARIADLTEELEDKSTHLVEIECLLSESLDGFKEDKKTIKILAEKLAEAEKESQRLIAERGGSDG